MDKPPRTSILLVDDRPERLLALEAILAPLGQELVCVNSGTGALRALLKLDPALILLDVYMPELSGLETARMIRQSPRLAHTPIIFITGSREWSDMEQAYALGAVDYITIPIVPCILRSKASVFVDLYQNIQATRTEKLARAREVNARRLAEEENEAKDDFLAAVSHELRTPLSPIFAALESLPDEVSPEVIRSTLHMMRRNLELQARLIDDLLEMSQVSHPNLALHREHFHMNNALSRAAAICEPEAKRRQVRLELEPEASPDFIHGDPARLQQVCWNLIHNAIKFTPAGASVRIRSHNPTPTEIQVDVVDTGIGIDPHHLHRIFRKFEQLNKPTDHRQRREGLGLGLTIAQTIVQLHSGKIWAESAGLGRGATFSFRLGLAEPTPSEPSPRADLSATRILLVDDHPDTRETLSRLLQKRGYLVVVAPTVTEAVKVIEQNTVDLIISDIGLPDGSGTDLMRFARSKQPGICGIAVSGFGSARDLQESLRAGFICHLVKPIALRELSEAIRQCLEPGAV